MGFPHWRSLGSMFQGWVTATGGRGAEGIAVFEAALAEHRATGEVIEVCYFLGVLAEPLGSNGRAEAGLPRIAEALDLVERTGGRWCEADQIGRASCRECVSHAVYIQWGVDS